MSDLAAWIKAGSYQWFAIEIVLERRFQKLSSTGTTTSLQTHSMYAYCMRWMRM
jgi:hypothetical protein